MTERDPRRAHPDFEPSVPPPKRVLGVEIRDKRRQAEPDDPAPTSISASGLLGWAARHGRSWNPIGIALMIVLIWAGLVLGVVYVLSSDPGKALVAAWRANTREVAALRADMKRLEAKADKAIAGNAAIRDELRVQGQGNATKRIVTLERNVELTGQLLVKLNGAPPNSSFPRSLEGAFRRPVDAPEPTYPRFLTDHQWALKPE